MARILLVEDNTDLLCVYGTFLRYAGYEVTEALDGESAVQLSSDVRFDLILMDISIPKMDGWQATAAIREREDSKDVIIVALTAHSLSKDKTESENAGCDGHISKPFGPKELSNEVRLYLDCRIDPHIPRPATAFDSFGS